jgi:hypothetical protein
MMFEPFGSGGDGRGRFAQTLFYPVVTVIPRLCEKKIA